MLEGSLKKLPSSVFDDGNPLYNIKEYDDGYFDLCYQHYDDNIKDLYGPFGMIGDLTRQNLLDIEQFREYFIGDNSGDPFVDFILDPDKFKLLESKFKYS